MVVTPLLQIGLSISRVRAEYPHELLPWDMAGSSSPAPSPLFIPSSLCLLFFSLTVFQLSCLPFVPHPFISSISHPTIIHRTEYLVAMGAYY